MAKEYPKLDNPSLKGRLRHQPAERAVPGPSPDAIALNQPNYSRAVPLNFEPTFSEASALHLFHERVSKEKRIMLKRVKRPLFLYALAGFVLLTGFTVGLLSLRSNNFAQAQIEGLNNQNSSSTAEPPPATAKPSDKAIANYKVAPDLPRYVDIKKIKVHSRVYKAGFTKTGALASPRNIYDAGWYSLSAKPGQAGAMLLDGHVSGWSAKGVFYQLNKLNAGDEISIIRGDGQSFIYRVVKSKVYDADKVDMASVLVSADTSKPGLNIITCSGEVIPGTNDYSKRLVVFAVAD